MNRIPAEEELFSSFSQNNTRRKGLERSDRLAKSHSGGDGSEISAKFDAWFQKELEVLGKVWFRGPGLLAVYCLLAMGVRRAVQG